mmetsp:Transcript_24737/g.46211  ORF Transcript_24737/g.46211 Transcript_24737/m.46211 type:complete len:82 (-) Transcript_24737:275-520(-)
MWVVMISVYIYAIAIAVILACTPKSEEEREAEAREKLRLDINYIPVDRPPQQQPGKGSSPTTSSGANLNVFLKDDKCWSGH